MVSGRWSMDAAMIRAWTKRASLFVFMGMLGLSAAPLIALAADHEENYWPDDNKSRAATRIDLKIETRADGVYIQIAVRQSTPGTAGTSASNESVSENGADSGRLNSGSNAGAYPLTSADSGRSGAGAVRPGRSWTDVTGYHYETPSGQLVTLTPPNISSATRESWVVQLQQHQNENPYLMYVDQQLNGVIWVPRTAGGGNLRLEPAPDSPLQQASLPTGNGNSTDPREVALDALGHQSLPNAQIRMNPDLGLVAMPGWFWVEGYDGSSFGTSRTVEIPPEVGSDVPDTVVPANDSRRRGSSFTVEVRLWPTGYAWSFGDGSTTVSQTLGRPYPAQSDIQHTYEFSSLQHPTGFPVRLTIDFAAEFRVNGGAPERLPTIQRTYESGYRVQELQPVLTGR
jgi:hypothetical protein